MMSSLFFKKVSLNLSMVVILNKDTDLQNLKKLLAERKPQKKFDAKRFCGALKTEEDGLKIQQQFRDEWR
ncbi:hypothetical protein Mucpa_2743 [Mucilaginibacter paludis DSM 18603]|uniref:Uncharacterized protein n=2 Tax=Mucilaginibacter TaxID=423349 RepID=H1Y6R3_9SPHI|nr:hypothetical protein Mucpa_2743 [Mucilaginibacter paludis DSM 18603]